MKKAQTLLFVMACMLGGCAGRSSSSGTDSSTQFWDTCETDSECGELSCLCGRCTAPCETGDSCGDVAETATCDSAAQFCGTAGALCVSSSWSESSEPSSEPSSAQSSDEVTAEDAGAKTEPAKEWPALPVADGTTLVEGATYQIALAATANEGALLFTIYNPDDSTERVLLQPLALDGTAAGNALELGSGGEHVSIASDGERYLACWQNETNVQCSAIDLGVGTVETVLDVAGRGVVASYGSNTWVIAYASDPDLNANSGLVLQPLSSTFELQPQVLFGELSAQAIPVLTSTASGFLLVDTDSVAGYELRSTRLDADLQPAGGSVAWGLNFWLTPPSVFVSDSEVVLSAPVPYAAQIMTRAAKVNTDVIVSGGGKSGLSVTFVDDGAGPILCWVNQDNAVQRQRVTALDRQAEVDVGVLSQPTPIVPLLLGGRQFVAAMFDNFETEGFEVKLMALD